MAEMAYQIETELLTGAPRYRAALTAKRVGPTQDDAPVGLVLPGRLEEEEEPSLRRGRRASRATCAR
jgi:hypothetical protein